jgi:hypothetical protein
MNSSKPVILIIFAVIFLGLTSCGKMDKETSGDLNLRFKLMYGEQPFEMFKEYKYPVTNNQFLMTRLSFFISDITLRSTAETLLIKDIDYLNLTAAHTPPLASNGFEYTIKGIQPGNYTSIDFGVGVPAASNAKAPKDFNSGSILSNAAEYWSSWKSYIFFRPEGQIALDGKPINETSFALHLGGDGAFRVVDLDKSIVVNPDQTTHVDIIIDLQKFFNGTSLYDIRSTQQIHSLTQMPLITQLADNLVIAFR